MEKVFKSGLNFRIKIQIKIIELRLEIGLNLTIKHFRHANKYPLKPNKEQSHKKRNTIK